MVLGMSAWQTQAACEIDPSPRRRIARIDIEGQMPSSFFAELLSNLAIAGSLIIASSF
jgi:hypothetical protein